MKKNYDSIDLFKFIFCILIVALHADALYDFSPVLNTMVCEGIARLGVPFFFVASAFFFFKKPVTWENTKKYCKRLLILYAAWFIVSLPKTVFDRFICSDYSLIETVIRFVRSFFVTSTFSGSWFIVSCIWCALLYYLLERQTEKRRRVITIVISVVIYLWTVLAAAYGTLIQNPGAKTFYDYYTLILGSPYCSLIVGVPYFALGRFFAKNENSVKNKKAAVVGFAVCFALLMAEVWLTNTHGLVRATDCYLMLLPCIYFLFPLISGWEIRLKNARLLRVSSTIIFFSQFLFLFACELAEYALHIIIPNVCKFLFAVVAGFLLTWIILKLKDKKGFGWLRWFY